MIWGGFESGQVIGVEAEEVAQHFGVVLAEGGGGAGEPAVGLATEAHRHGGEAVGAGQRVFDGLVEAAGVDLGVAVAAPADLQLGGGHAPGG